MDYAILYSFVVSLAIGALVGIERERRRHEGVGGAGVRTFMIISLFGTLAAMISHQYYGYFILVAFLALAVIVAMEYSFTSRATKDLPCA